MNKQVDDILVNHYCRYYEDENGEQNFSVLRLKVIFVLMLVTYTIGGKS